MRHPVLGAWWLISNLKEESLRAPWVATSSEEQLNEKQLAWFLLGGSQFGACFRRSAKSQGTGSNRYGDRKVVDSSGAALPGAVVNVKSVERGVVYSATTNDVGLYRVPQLPIGNYEVRVEKTGFSSVAYPAFTLSLNQVARIDVEMKVGQVTETVVVSGAAPILKTESTQVDTIIDAATNDALPSPPETTSS